MLNRKVAFLSAFFLMSVANAFPEKYNKRDLTRTASEMEKSGDDLGLRIIGRNLLTQKLDLTTWSKLHDIYSRRPGVGWDLLRAWDKIRPKLVPTSEKRFQDVEAQMSRADELMLSKEFEKAFELYQQVATTVKKSPDFKQKQNFFFYQDVVHDMARALYGAGRFTEALTVYGWVGPLYPQLRKVFFEKMWAAFRAGRMDVANGAIASQYSSYFSNYIEPESYLIQVYIYKKLCREEDLKHVITLVKDFQSRLKSGSYTYKDWAKNDFDTIALLQLIKQDREVGSGFVSPQDRTQEKTKLVDALKHSFEANHKRLQDELDLVVAYSTLSFSTTKEDMPTIEKLPTPKELSKAGLEFWPVEDGEDWLDEFGYHLFIGDSQCSRGSQKL